MPGQRASPSVGPPIGARSPLRCATLDTTIFLSLMKGRRREMRRSSQPTCWRSETGRV